MAFYRILRKNSGWKITERTPETATQKEHRLTPIIIYWSVLFLFRILIPIRASYFIVIQPLSQNTKICTHTSVIGTSGQQKKNHTKNYILTILSLRSENRSRACVHITYTCVFHSLSHSLARLLARSTHIKFFSYLF